MKKLPYSLHTFLECLLINWRGFAWYDCFLQSQAQLLCQQQRKDMQGYQVPPCLWSSVRIMEVIKLEFFKF
jgi:hypothetical protein